ncbi:MAG: DUF2975 domain-containing protein [Candidatus Limnocylindrales bacterium]
MEWIAIRLLRLSIVVLLLVSVLGQLLVPWAAAASVETFPEVEYLVVPYSVAGILVIACGQLALLVTWRLLSMIDHGVIFTRRALRLVDVIIVCGAVATILNAAVWVHLLAVHGGGPGIILWLMASTVCGTAFVLLMVVMRGLLEAAIDDRTELAEVI